MLVEKTIIYLGQYTMCFDKAKAEIKNEPSLNTKNQVRYHNNKRKYRDINSSSYEQPFYH